MASERLVAAGSFLLSVFFTLVCYFAAGSGLGLFFGGFFVAVFFAPVPGAWKAAAAGVALVWLIAVIQTSDTFWEWARLAMLLVCFAGALGSIAYFLRQAGEYPVVAGMYVTILGLAWLTWPIWLSPQFEHLSENLIDRLVSFYPPLVANGVLHHEAPWTEEQIAYQMTRLNQDTPIHLPTQIWSSAGVHAGIGVIFCGLGWGIGRILRRKGAGD
jgi:hypothetical protein